MRKHDISYEAESLEHQVVGVLADLLKPVPAISNLVMELPDRGHTADIIARAKIAGRTCPIVVNVERNGQPRIARNAIGLWELSRRNNKLDNSYFVFAAPFVSPKAQAILKEAGVGFLDLAGNCYLAFENIFIERIGNTRETEKRLIRSLFYEKSSRVIRRLLNDPFHPWHVQELATTAQVSTGLVSQIKTKLIDSELVERRGDMFVLTRPEELIKQWSAAYDLSKNDQAQFYSDKPLSDLDEMVAAHCSKNKIEYAFTLFSGAGLIGAQYMRVVNRASAYVWGNPKMLGQYLDLKPVDSGGNLLLLRPPDFDVLFGKRNIRGRWVVSDVQLFLDFSTQQGRAQETAEFILNARLRNTWAEK